MRTPTVLALAGSTIAALIAGCAPADGLLHPALMVDGMAVGAGDGQFHAAGKAHLAAGRLGPAATAFQTALARDGESLPTLNALAATYDRLGRPDLADRYYHRALELDPDDPQTLNNLGYSLLLRGQGDRARLLLEAARAAAPDDAVINANLAAATAAPPPVAASAAERRPPPPPRPTRQVWLERTAPGVMTVVMDMAAGMAAHRLFVPPEVAHTAGTADSYLAAPSRHAALLIERLTGRPAAETAPLAAEPPPVTPAPQVAVQTEILPPMPASAASAAKAADMNKEFRTASNPAVCSLQIANGAGRTRMAARMRQYLAAKGVAAGCLTNGERSDYASTVVFYREGRKTEAVSLAKLFPIPVEVRLDPLQVHDIQLRLGHDLIDFDLDLTARGVLHET